MDIWKIFDVSLMFGWIYQVGVSCVTPWTPFGIGHVGYQKKAYQSFYFIFFSFVLAIFASLESGYFLISFLRSSLELVLSLISRKATA